MNAICEETTSERGRGQFQAVVLSRAGPMFVLFALASYLVIAGADGRRSQAVADLYQIETTNFTVLKGQTATVPISNFDTTLGTLLEVVAYGSLYVDGTIYVNNTTSEYIYENSTMNRGIVYYLYTMSLQPFGFTWQGFGENASWVLVPAGYYRAGFAPGLTTIGLNMYHSNPFFFGNYDPGSWSDMFGGSKTISLSAWFGGDASASTGLQVDDSQVMGSANVQIEYVYAPVPEPSTLFLAVGGGFGLLYYFRRVRR